MSSAKGKPGEQLICSAVDEMAAVGTIIELKYMVQDLTRPQEVASTVLTRTITIVEPCAATEHFCEDDRTCSQVCWLAKPYQHSCQQPLGACDEFFFA